MKIDCKSDFAFRSADFCSLQEESELGVSSFICSTESPEYPLLFHHSQGDFCFMQLRHYSTKGSWDSVPSLSTRDMLFFTLQFLLQMTEALFTEAGLCPLIVTLSCSWIVHKYTEVIKGTHDLLSTIFYVLCDVRYRTEHRSGRR